MFSYLTPENVFQKYKDAKKYTDSLTEPFPEFERIARNRPHESIDPNYPRTTDGTTASIIRKTPRRVVQQLPTGEVKSDNENDWLPIVANFILTHKIIPSANEEYELIQKSWMALERALTFGSCPTYTPFLNHDGYFCPDLSIPYWGDVSIPRGKRSGYTLPYQFLDSWWQKEDLEALIDRENKLEAEAKKAKRKYEATWDSAALQKILNEVTTKDAKQLTPSEKERTTDISSGILLVTGFQKGVGAKFYTFNPKTETIVRTKVNKDPRGNMPIDWMYGDVDGNNPLGRGIVELIGGLQNLIDSDMQMYQYNRALMLDPPLLKRGSMSKSKVRYAIHEVIDLGTDPTNGVEAMTVDTKALENYPQLYGLQKSQLLNLVNSPDTSISADAGNPSFSKTDAGVKSQQSTISVDDNFTRKMFEAWFQNWCETAINLWFAERTGIDEIELDADTVLKLEQLAEGGYFDPSLLQDNKLRINYDTATPALKFRVDASTSKQQDDAQQLQLIQEALQTVTPQVSYYMGQDGWKFNTGEAYRTLLLKLGIANIDKIVTKMSDQEAAEAKQAPFPIIDPPQIRLTGQIPPGAMGSALQMGGVQTQDGQLSNDQPVDLGDIYKDPMTSPAVKAQIQHLAGLQPDVQASADQMTTQQFQHQADQQQALGAVSPPPVTLPTPPQSPDTQQPQQPQPAPNPHDVAIAQELKKLGASDVQIQQAIAMLDSGKSDQEVMQMLAGAPNGQR